eukprot:12547703-Alexandrium_andersonii.AAC.1
MLHGHLGGLRARRAAAAKLAPSCPRGKGWSGAFLTRAAQWRRVTARTRGPGVCANPCSLSGKEGRRNSKVDQQAEQACA